MKLFSKYVLDTRSNLKLLCYDSGALLQFEAQKTVPGLDSLVQSNAVLEVSAHHSGRICCGQSTYQ